MAQQRAKKSPPKKRTRRRGSSNGSPAERRKQEAAAARAKVDERRKQMSGASGWVASRAGGWGLDERDDKFIGLLKYFWNPAIDYWFRMTIEGWERIPPPPALLIGIHSGAPFVWDAWTVGLQWGRRFGRDRPIHGTAHDALMGTPLVGRFFRSMGVLPAAPDAIPPALAEKRDVILWPGGEV